MFWIRAVQNSPIDNKREKNENLMKANISCIQKLKIYNKINQVKTLLVCPRSANKAIEFAFEMVKFREKKLTASCFGLP